MSNDLISRSAAIEEFYKRVSGDLSIEDVQYIEKVIKSVPVAYDVDNVVDQLEEKYLMGICRNDEPCDYPEKIGCCFDRAIKDCVVIVKAGFERYEKPEREE